jgi:type VI secretion system protein VasG
MTPGSAPHLGQEIQTIKQKLIPFLTPLELHLHVDRTIIAHVLHSWTGIPMETMTSLHQHQSAAHLFHELSLRIMGQRHALRLMAERVSCYFSQLTDPSKPMGIFALVGPSGVGKTETAHALSALLTGSEASLIRINMTEFQESHSVATLRGAPPGYIGYGKGGVLTEAIRRNPYSVILLDEIEKAHPDVMEIFYQVFDKGVLEDGEGLEVDFRNTLIILTTNLGSEKILQAWQHNKGPVDQKFMEALQEMVLPDLEEHLRPALVARLQVVPYHPLGDQELAQIARLKLSALAHRLWNHHTQELIIVDQDVAKIVAQCQRTPHGARLIDGIINQSILPRLSEILLTPEVSQTIHLDHILTHQREFR